MSVERVVENEEYGIPRVGSRVGTEIIEEDVPRVTEPPERVIFVDGKVRHLMRYDVLSSKGLLSQIVVGAFVYEGKNLKPLKDPERIFVLCGTPPFMKEYEMEELLGLKVIRRVVEPTGVVDLGNMAKTVMAEMEARLTVELIESENAVVVKDGSLKPIYEMHRDYSFTPMRGPVGLVKSVEESPGPEIEDILIRNLKVGDRSKAFVRRYIVSREKTIEVVSSYLKVGENSFMRMDAVNVGGKLGDILGLFDSLGSLIPHLTVDIPLGRLPEDIFPMQSLEEYLNVFFFEPGVIGAVLQKSQGVL